MTRKLVILAGLLLILSLTVAVWFYTAATSPQAVRAELEGMTGARVEVGQLERLWLPPGLALHQVSFQSPAYQLTVDELVIHLKWLPLLRGRGVPARLGVRGAQLSLRQGTPTLPLLPLEASWDVRELEIRAPVKDRPQTLFYLQQLSYGSLPGLGRRLTLVGGPSTAQPESLQLTGRVTGSSAGALPEGDFRLQLDAFPPQPLLTLLAGDDRLLARTTMDALWTLESRQGAASVAGTLGVTAPDGDEVLASRLRLRAGNEQLEIESFTGHLVQNRFSVTGEIRRWLDARREIDLTLRLPEVQVKAETIHLLQELLGRESLAFAENTRGRLAADLRFVSALEGQQLTGTVSLRGLTLAAPGLPVLENMRGRLGVLNNRLDFTEVTLSLWQTPASLTGRVDGRRLDLELRSDPVPLARLPLPPEEELPVENLHGQVQLEVQVAGDVEQPAISGTAGLTGGGLDFRQVQVRQLEGQAAFTPRRVGFDPIRGRAEQCSFELSGGFQLARWRESLQVRALAPACELSELLGLVERAGFGRLPGIDPADLEGTGTVVAEYTGQDWQAEVEVEDARWSPERLALPAEDIRARVRVNPSAVQLRRLSGRLGGSSFNLRGRAELAGSALASWELELATEFEPQDVERLLPAAWRRWVMLDSPLEGRALLAGSPEDGSELEARVYTPVASPGGDGDGLLSSSYLPAGTAPVSQRALELRGVWQEPVFELRRLTATLGSSQLTLGGQIRWESQKHFDLRLNVPPGSSLAELLAFVRLPSTLEGMQGALGADLALEGAPQQLVWHGTLDLEDVRLPGVLTEPVALTGRVVVRPQEFELQAIDVRQPQGGFTLSGQLRTQGTSSLDLSGPWANLDRLLGQLPEGKLSDEHREFLARHPLRASLSIDQVQFLQTVFTDVRGTLEQQEGDFRLHIPGFAIGEGRGELRVELDSKADRMNASLTLEQVQTEALLSDVLKQAPTVRAPLDVRAQLSGPRGGQAEFLRGARGRVDFVMGNGRIQKGTLPERLFALAAMLHEGFYGFGILRLARLTNPPDLRHFQNWTGTVQVEDGKARLRSPIVAENYDVTLTGEVDLGNDDFRMHGEGNFHPGWQFDISLKSLIDGLSRLFRLARGKRGLNFEFDVSGKLGKRKSVENFRFKD